MDGRDAPARRYGQEINGMQVGPLLGWFIDLFNSIGWIQGLDEGFSDVVFEGFQDLRSRAVGSMFLV